MAIAPPRDTKHETVRLWYIDTSSTGKALRFVMGPTRAKAGNSYVWIPLSMIWRAPKNEDRAKIKDGEDYPEWKIMIPSFLIDQKNLRSQVVP